MTKVEVRKLHSFSGHRDCVYTVVPADSPALFFSGAGDGMVVLWDLDRPDEGQQIAQLPNSVYALHYLERTDLLVAGHNYDGIHFLDWRKRKEVASLQLTTAAIFDIVSHGEDILVATGEGTLVVVDSGTRTVRARIGSSQRSARCLAINRVTNELAVGYSDHCIRIFDLKDYALLREWVAHTNSVFTVRYSPDGKTLLSGSRDARLKAWSARSNYELEEEIAAHLFAINHAVFSPDGKHFVTCSMDKSVKVWEAYPRKLLKVIDKARHAGHGTSVNKLLWTSFNNQLVSASDDRSISVWDLFFKLQQTGTKT